MDQLTTLFKDPLAEKIIYLMAGLTAIFVINRLIRRVADRVVHERSFKFQTRKILNFIGYIAAIFTAMIIFEVNLSGVGVAFGVAGAGIAFALQEVIASIAGYLAIHLANFYRVGDRVELGGIKGDVIDISVLRTTIMEMGDWVKGDLYNGKMVRVANSFVFKEPVFNYSGDFPFLWDEITIPIKTNSDHALMRDILQQTLTDEVGSYVQVVEHAWEKMKNQYQIENARLEPMISMTFDENWATYTLRYIVDFKSRRGTKDKLFTKILDRIHGSQGKIEVASAAYEITAFPKVNLVPGN